MGFAAKASTSIVTGAASGIGLGIATAVAEAAASVAMADIQKDAVEQAALSDTTFAHIARVRYHDQKGRHLAILGSVCHLEAQTIGGKP